MGGHLKGPQFQQSLAAPGGGGIEKFVDTKLSPVGIAAHIHQQMAEKPVQLPERNLALGRDTAHGVFQFIQGVVPGLIGPGRLAGGSHEKRREKIRQAGMFLPISDHGRKQPGLAEEGAFFGDGSAHDQMASAARPDRSSIDGEFDGGEPDLPGLLIKNLKVGLQRSPIGGRMNVHF